MNAKKIYTDFEGAMPDSIGKRIDKFLRGKGITRAEFGRECGTSGTTAVTNYIEEKSKPNAEFMTLAAKKFDLNPLWLLLGQGPMLLSDAEQECPSALKEPPTDYDPLVDDLRHKVADLEFEIRQERLRIFDAVAAECRRAGLTPQQTRDITGAVMDPHGVLAAEDGATPHQAAAGE